MTNAQVFEAFTNRKPAQANNVRSEIIADRAILYSYGTPVAINDGDTIFVDMRKYSVTTSKQLTQMAAYSSRFDWERIDHERFRRMCKAFCANLDAAL